MSGFFSVLARVGLIRLLVLGILLLLGDVLIQAFRVEIGVKRHLPPALEALCIVAFLAALLGLYAVLVRAFERRWPSELALRPAPRWLGLGLAIGLMLFCGVYLIFTIMGLTRWGGYNGLAYAGPALLMAAIAGVGEELVFRGALFRILENSFGTTLALVASAAVFGLLHAANPGATLVSTLAIALEAGVLLAAVYAWSRSLWLPIGLHIAWNFTEGGVFDAAVSGGHARGIFAVDLSPSAPAMLTGGAFGPEASVVSVGVCLAVALAFMALTVRAGRWRKPAFRLLLNRGKP